MRFRSNEEVINYLFSRRRMNIKLGLDSINHLLEKLDSPETHFRSVHVAGTNGKGSTCAILESIFLSNGLKTGLYTSPHLTDVRERIRIDGKSVSLDLFKKTIELLFSTIEKYGCSFFEILTAVAFAHFCDQQVDIAIIETGLGGRLDATNVLIPEISVITEIDIDHVKQLGDTLLQIAREKAGIIKPGVPVLSGASNRKVDEYFESVCRKKRSKFISAPRDTDLEIINCHHRGSDFNLVTPDHRWQNLKLSLLGHYQVINSVTAIRTIEELNRNNFDVDKNAVYSGLKNVNWPGRLQVLQNDPVLVVDVAHNIQGISSTISAITQIFSYQKMICVLGLLADKKTSEIINILNPYVDLFVAVTPDNERALPAQELAKRIEQTGKRVKIGQTIGEGLELAMDFAKNKDLVCVLGSHFVIGEILNIYKKS